MKCKICSIEVEEWRLLRSHFKKFHKVEYKAIVDKIGGKPPPEYSEQERRVYTIPFSSLSKQERVRLGIEGYGYDSDEDGDK